MTTKVLDHQILESITGAANIWRANVPYDYEFADVLAPGFLNSAHTLLKPGDSVELYACDWSWLTAFLVTSVKRLERTVTARMITSPTFLLGSIDLSPGYLTDMLDEVERDYRQERIGRHEFECRWRLLESLRDNGRWPSEWVADKLLQLHRAHEGGLINRRQRHTASEELCATMSEEQMGEVTEIMRKALPSAPEPEPTPVTGGKKSKKAPAAPTISP